MGHHRPGLRQRISLKKRLRCGHRITGTTWVTNVSGETIRVVLDGRRKKWREAGRSNTPGNPWSYTHWMRDASGPSKAGSPISPGPDSGEAGVESSQSANLPSAADRGGRDERSRIHPSGV